MTYTIISANPPIRKERNKKKKKNKNFKRKNETQSNRILNK